MITIDSNGKIKSVEKYTIEVVKSEYVITMCEVDYNVRDTLSGNKRTIEIISEHESFVGRFAFLKIGDLGWAKVLCEHTREQSDLAHDLCDMVMAQNIDGNQE